MTHLEAYERAAKIWGHDRILNVHVTSGGGADVELKPGMSWETGKTPGHLMCWHVLDSNGHPACHDECRKLDA